MATKETILSCAVKYENHQLSISTSFPHRHLKTINSSISQFHPKSSSFKNESETVISPALSSNTQPPPPYSTWPASNNSLPPTLPLSDSTATPNPRFKTKMCRNMKEKGICLYSSLCQFAHGKEEVRSAGKMTKYKTDLCQKYWIKGYCVYGPTCHFVHYEKTPVETLPHIPQTVSGTVNTVRHEYVDVNMNDYANTVRHKYVDVNLNDYGNTVRHKYVDVNMNDSGNSSFGSDSKFLTTSPTHLKSLTPPRHPGPPRHPESPRHHETSIVEDEFLTLFYGPGSEVREPDSDIFAWIDTWTQKFL